MISLCRVVADRDDECPVARWVIWIEVEHLTQTVIAAPHRTKLGSAGVHHVRSLCRPLATVLRHVRAGVSVHSSAALVTQRAWPHRWAVPRPGVLRVELADRYLHRQIHLSTCVRARNAVTAVVEVVEPLPTFTPLFPFPLLSVSCCFAERCPVCVHTYTSPALTDADNSVFRWPALSVDLRHFDWAPHLSYRRCYERPAIAVVVIAQQPC